MARSGCCSAGSRKGAWCRCARKSPAACRRRAPAEIAGGQGAKVLDGHLPVLTVEGEDVTAAFIDGAQQALALVAQHGIRMALLKARSPSCGNREAYDGSFSGTQVAGEGVTAAALRRAGVRVFSEEELVAAQAFLAVLDGAD